MPQASNELKSSSLASEAACRTILRADLRRKPRLAELGSVACAERVAMAFFAELY